MARLTAEQCMENYRAICQKAKRLKELNAERVAEEKALSEEYKVAECNTKRNEIAIKYKAIGDNLHAEITALQDAIGAE